MTTSTPSSGFRYSKFKEAVLALLSVQKSFERGEISSMVHGRIRSERLGQAVVAMAEEMGVHLLAPIHINSNGEYPLNVDTNAGSTRYGEEFANAVTPFQPRTGAAAGAHLHPSNGWCWLNHFSAEKMVRARFDAQLMQPQEAWGNPPEVEKMLDENRKEMEASSVRRHARLDALTPEQREFIEVLHYQSKDSLHVDAALDVNDRLHELSAQHYRLAQIGLSERGLDKAQERVQDDVETQLILLAHEIPGVLEPKFLYDPRGTTVGLIFESGAHNSLNGSYKVPLNPARVKELAHEDFQSAFEALKRADQERGVRHVMLSIESTGTAAFVDAGREQEVARIIDEAADKVDDLWDNGDGERHPLRDRNENTVGHLEFSTEPPRGQAKGDFWLDVECNANADDPAHEAAQHLREAAFKVRRGEDLLAIFDANGSRVGMGSLRESTDLDQASPGSAFGRPRN